MRLIDFKVVSKNLVVNFLIIIFGLLATESVAAQNCGELSVEKDRSFKAVTKNGANFFLELKNTTSSTQVYTLKISQLDTPCDNNINRSAKANSKLDVDVVNALSRTKVDNSISLRAGEIKKIEIKITAPKNTPYNTWGCVEVTAVNDGCSSRPSQVVLSSLVVDPSEN